MAFPGTAVISICSRRPWNGIGRENGSIANMFTALFSNDVFAILLTVRERHLVSSISGTRTIFSFGGDESTACLNLNPADTSVYGQKTRSDENNTMKPRWSW